MKKNAKKLVMILAALISFSSFIFAEEAVKVSFNAKDINNKNITDAVFKDADLTMINIWGTFCGPCISEMPDLGKLNKEYGDKNFQIAGIVIDAVNRKGMPVQKTIDAAKQIVKQTGADYLHIVPDYMLINGILRDVYAVPTTIFVDKNGKQVGPVYTGSRSLAEWKTIVDGLLK